MSTRSIVKNLQQSFKSRDIETAQRILSKYTKLVHPDSDDFVEGLYYSPLGLAIKFKCAKIVQFIIDLGVDINKKFSLDRNKYHLYYLTFLHFIAFLTDDSQRIEAAKILIENGSDVNICFASKHSITMYKTPLQVAIAQGRLQYAEYLLKNGARLKNGPEWSNYSDDPMDLILKVPKCKQKKMLLLLIQYGLDTASLNYRTGYDYLMLTIKTAICHPHAIDLLEISKVLLNNGVPVNGIDSRGVSVLLWAINLKNIELISEIIDKGADVNLKSEYKGLFPLFLAIKYYSKDIIKFLLSKGAKVNAITKSGSTALHKACFHSNKELIKILLEHGADVNAETSNGYTPLYFLDLRRFNEEEGSCIKIILKEIAKSSFLNEFVVSRQNIDLIKTYSKVEELFQSCIKELNQMSITKFYSGYSYYWVLNTTKKTIKKLANLTKNVEFVLGFEANFNNFTYFKDDLKRIFEEAFNYRDRSFIVEIRLKHVFVGSCPDVVIRKLASYLSVDDLPLDSMTNIIL